MELQYDKDSKERIPYEHYMELLQKADPEEISARTGIPYDQQSQTFTLHLLGVAYQVHFPDYVVRHDGEYGRILSAGKRDQCPDSGTSLPGGRTRCSVDRKISDLPGDARGERYI